MVYVQVLEASEYEPSILQSRHDTKWLFLFTVQKQSSVRRFV